MYAPNGAIIRSIASSILYLLFSNKSRSKLAASTYSRSANGNFVTRCSIRLTYPAASGPELKTSNTESLKADGFVMYPNY